MAKDEQEKTPERNTTASQAQTMERAFTERDPRHGSHVVNGTIDQGSISSTRIAGPHRDRGPGGISAHFIHDTRVDGTSNVLNGNGTNGHGPPTRSFHLMHGGSVSNHSRVANGNLSKDGFLEFFCNSR